MLKHQRHKALLKDENVFMVFTEPRKQSSGGHDLGLVHPNEATVFSSTGEVAKLLVMDADRGIKKPMLSASYLYILSIILERICCLCTAIYMLI